MVASVPHHEVLSKLLLGRTGCGTGATLVRPHRVKEDDLDSMRGLHSYRAALELRTPGDTKLPRVWMRDYFEGVTWWEARSTPQLAVFELVPRSDKGRALKGESPPSLLWKSSAFSGVMPYAMQVDIALEDEDGEMMWATSQLGALERQPLVEMQMVHAEGYSSYTTTITDGHGGIRLIL